MMFIASRCARLLNSPALRQLVAACSIVIGQIACKHETQPVRVNGPSLPGTSETATGWPEWMRRAETLGLPLDERCAILGTVLTFQPAVDGGRGSSMYEAAELNRSEARDERLLLAAYVVDQKSAPVGSFFRDQESCGDAAVVLTNASKVDGDHDRFVAQLELSPLGADRFDFRGQLATLSGTLSPRLPTPMRGRLTRDRNDWRITVEGRSQFRTPKQIDSKPIETVTPDAFEPNRVEAWFEFDTGGDSMGSGPVETGLVVVVRYARTLLRQTIDSCPEASGGSALGATDARTLDIAVCSHTFQLISEPGQVRVDRVGEAGTTTVTRFDLPHGTMRAVLPISSGG